MGRGLGASGELLRISQGVGRRRGEGQEQDFGLSFGLGGFCKTSPERPCEGILFILGPPGPSPIAQGWEEEREGVVWLPSPATRFQKLWGTKNYEKVLL